MNALLVSGQDGDRRTLDTILRGTPWGLVAVPDLASAIVEFNQAVFPIVLCDRDVSDGPWQEMVKALVAVQAGACIILISSVSDQYLWDEVVQNGGFDVLTRPLEKRQVLSTLDFAHTHWKTGRGAGFSLRRALARLVGNGTKVPRRLKPAPRGPN